MYEILSWRFLGLSSFLTLYFIRSLQFNLTLTENWRKSIKRSFFDIFGFSVLSDLPDAFHFSFLEANWSFIIFVILIRIKRKNRNFLNFWIFELIFFWKLLRNILLTARKKRTYLTLVPLWYTKSTETKKNNKCLNNR